MTYLDRPYMGSPGRSRLPGAALLPPVAEFYDGGGNGGMTAVTASL
ncbi:MAG: hypothetical protein L6R19_20505 [Alphaproteobacteria bacterium]|nr:hypothetical protein [Alphaproteobacteria bacterium]